MADSQLRVLSFTPTEKGVDVLLSGDLGAAAARIAQFFETNGFRLEEGTSAAGVYGKGNKVARALLGGWVKREKFDVNVVVQGDSVVVQISSGMSGWGGSAVGRAREKKARKLIADELGAFLGVQTGGASGSP
jgi:hypothetical protein